MLYYNTELAPTPPATLEQLAADARSGKTVLVAVASTKALWGFHAFGASLIDPHALTFNQGGFVNWLTWLQQARETPVLSSTRIRSCCGKPFSTSRASFCGAGE